MSSARRLLLRTAQRVLMNRSERAQRQLDVVSDQRVKLYKEQARIRGSNLFPKEAEQFVLRREGEAALKPLAYLGPKS